MEIVLKLKQVDDGLVAGQRHALSLPSAVREILNAVRGTSRPMHPDEPDPDLRRYFVGTVPDDKVDDALKLLRDSQLVEAAYTKPADEPP